MKKIHEDKFKIYYENTDSSGFTYHTAYLSMAERARSNMLNKDFPELTQMLKKNSKFFVVKNIKVDFFKPAKLFDNLDIITFYTGNSFTSLNLTQKIEKNGIDISKIDIQLVWIDGEKKKPIKIPRNIIYRFKSMDIV
tara:strand:- start:364 stop:777 length:414 start_codon:yes stop_codon:yes gene_type:complete